MQIILHNSSSEILYHRTYSFRAKYSILYKTTLVLKHSYVVEPIYFMITDIPMVATRALDCRQDHLQSHIYCIINLCPHSISHIVHIKCRRNKKCLILL